MQTFLYLSSFYYKNDTSSRISKHNAKCTYAVAIVVVTGSAMGKVKLLPTALMCCGQTV